MKSCTLQRLASLALLFVWGTTLHAQFAGQVINFSLDRYNSLPNGDKETVHEGDNLAVIHFRGWTPADEYQTGASIGVDVTAEPAAGSLPAKMTFYTGALEQLPRMTILENGWIGIGTTTPQDLLDINGNTIIRGDRVWFGLNSTFGDGGLAFKHQPDEGFAGLPTDVLGINSEGEFAGGVYVGCPGLRVCGTLEAECLKVMRHIGSEEGNIVALGGSGAALDCDAPGEGDFIAYGSNGDFIAHYGHFIANEGDFRALAGNMTAFLDITSTTGDIRALGGDVVANQNLTAENGNVTASAGNVIANQQLIAENGDIDALNGSVNAAQNLNAGANLDVAGDATVGGVMRIGTITGDPGTHSLAVGGSIIATEVKVALQDDWPDYVFDKHYRLPTLAEIKQYTAAHGHLPGMPSAEEVAAAGGIELGEQQRLLTEKVEELYLHLIQLSERVEQLEKENAALRAQLAKKSQ